MTDLPSRRWKPPREETVAHAITPSSFCQTQIKTTDSDSRPALIHGYGECGQSARIQRQFPNLAVFTNSELFSCHFFFFFWSVVHQQGGPGETPLLFLVPRIEGRRFARFHWSAICNSHFAAAERSTVRKPESAA